MEMSDIINYRDNTHVITDYRYDSFGRRIHTAERTKSGMRTIYDGLSFEVVKEAETFLGTRGITSSATGEANLNNYNPQVPQNGWPNNTAPSYGSDHTKGTRYYYIPNNAQGSQTQQGEGRTNTAPSYGSDHTKGTRYYYIPDNAQRVQTTQGEGRNNAAPTYGSDHTSGTRYYHIPNNTQGAQAQHSAIPADRTKGVRTYLYLNGERVAVNNLYNTNHGQYYYGSDILGSVKFITGQGGQELKRIEYDVFGGIYKGNSPYGLETGYTGKPYDAVTRLSDYGFRDYAPTHARFITEDPIRDGENWFAYVGNNPVNWVDPWGLSASDEKKKIGTDGFPKNMDETERYLQGRASEQVINGFHDAHNHRISQNELRPEKPNGPCFFRSLQAAAEEKVGKNLSLEQIKASGERLHQAGVIGKNNKEFYYVNEPKKVLEDATKMLGYPNAKVTIGTRGKSTGTADYTIRFIQSKGHFQLGTSLGDLLYEPYQYSNPANSFTGKASELQDITINLEGD